MKKFEVLHQVVLFNGTVVQPGDVIEEKFVTRRMKELGLVREIQESVKTQEVEKVKVQKTEEPEKVQETQETKKSKQEKNKKSEDSKKLLIDDSSEVQVTIE